MGVFLSISVFIRVQNICCKNISTIVILKKAEGEKNWDLIHKRRISLSSCNFIQNFTKLAKP